ncbi:hypothetical protein DL769_004915 [Monosporascus sp. CRB-8-3]|nr:hypothetical protein DL769_004915 [Monosporascus sp. CRB-8-3]
MRSIRRIIVTVSSVWLAVAGFASALTSVRGKPFPSLIDVTIDDLQEGLGNGLFSSVDLVNAYLARIQEVNGTLHAVTEVNPDALHIAHELDSMRVNGTNLGPLHGVPILIKNNIATKDKMDNSAGSWALVGAKVPVDSFMAQKLRKAGAIILGKTNLSQWANYRSSNSSNGWSAHGGQVLAPYYLNQDPSGSSSGSGVASALGLALASLGTETSGSILSPAQKNNIVGIKPTIGLTSRHLVIPISEHQDTIGPMARTVKDAAIILGAIAGFDPKDNYTRAIPHCGKIPHYAARLDAEYLKEARIGVPYNVLPRSNNSEEMVAFWSAIELMQNEGATIVDASWADASAPTSSAVLPADFISNLASYLAELTVNPHNIHSLEELREFTQSFPLEQYPDRNTATWDSALGLGYNNTDFRFWEALQMNYYAGGEAGLLGAYERNEVDVIVMPSSNSPGLAAIVGAPVVTVPMGFYPEDTEVVTNSRGLVTRGPNIPYGLSFMGGRFTEEKLIKAAYAYEQKSLVRNRVQPYIMPTTEIGDFAGF